MKALTLFVLSVVVLFGALWQFGQAGVRTVALFGDPAPGAPAGVTFGTFESYAAPTLNNRGDVAFESFLTDDSIGIWVTRNGNSMELASITGQRAPGRPDLTNFDFVGMGQPLLNDRGQLAFMASVQTDVSANSNRTGIWREGTSEGLSLVVLEGQQIAGAPGESYLNGTLRSLRTNNAENLAFMSGHSANPELWTVDSDDNLVLIARDGDTNPNLQLTYRLNTLYAPSLNDNGQIAFRGPGALRYSPGLGVERINGNVQSRGDTISPSYVYDPLVNSFGQLAFFATNDVNGSPIYGDSGVWTTAPNGTLRSVVRKGDLVPGFPSDAIFDVFTQNEMVFNDLGDIVFNSHIDLNPGKDYGRLWLSHPGDGLIDVRAEGLPILNNRGQLVVLGTSVDSPQDFGFWTLDENGQLVPILLLGEQISVDNGNGIDLRTVDDLRLSWDRSLGFNDFGELAFSAKFTDGSSGIFVSDAVAVLRGDYDGNGTVGPEDYGVWKSHFGTTDLAADGNGDGIVDAADFTVWRNHLGETRNPSGGGSFANVPEATGLQMVLAMAVVSGYFRRNVNSSKSWLGTSIAKSFGSRKMMR